MFLKQTNLGTKFIKIFFQALRVHHVYFITLSHFQVDKGAKMSRFMLAQVHVLHDFRTHARDIFSPKANLHTALLGSSGETPDNPKP